MNMMNRSFGGRPMATPGTAAPAPRSGPQPTLGVRPPSGPVPPGGRPGLQPARVSSAKADDMFIVMRQLCDLLTKENAALKRYRTDEVKALSDRKEQLARLYQSHMNGIHTDPSILQGLDTAKRTSLIQLAARLADLMRDNASMLKANIQSINTFFEAVTTAVREREEKKSASYSRGGVLNGYVAVKRNLAVSYNQTT